MKPSVPSLALALLAFTSCREKQAEPTAARPGEAPTVAESTPVEQLSDDPSFLAGTWEKVSDPDGEPKDWLLFNLPAQLTRLGGGKPVKMLNRGGFLFTGQWIETRFDGENGQKLDGSLEVSKDHRQLFLDSPATGHRKTYQRGSPP